jgi:fructuronate reductase
VKVARPLYNLDEVTVGVAHLGLGAFHRAHQAVYFDDLLQHSSRYGICATSLNSAKTTAALRAQGNRYGLAILEEPQSYRVIGSIRQTIDPGDPGFLARVALPSTHLVTLTVTEKGYCLTQDGTLDWSQGDLEHDRAERAKPRTAIGLLAAALEARRRAGAPGLAIVSCDNLPSNGDRLRAAMLAFAEVAYDRLAPWIAGEVRFFNAMVDAITPASDGALRDRVSAACGFDDQCAVQREGFSSWVIDAALAKTHPELAEAGVVFSRDVGAHERAKLRMLNGAHSSLAYVGLAGGFDTVAAAMAEPVIAEFVGTMMEQEIGPGVATPEIDISRYRKSLLARFANPSVKHLLTQIAMDGSQKIPIRLLNTVRENIAVGRGIDRLCVGIAAWMRWIVRSTKAGVKVEDPLAAQLRERAAQASGNAAQDVAAFLDMAAVFPRDLAASPAWRAALTRGYQAILEVERNGIQALAQLGTHETHKTKEWGS